MTIHVQINITSEDGVFTRREKDVLTALSGSAAAPTVEIDSRQIVGAMKGTTPAEPEKTEEPTAPAQEPEEKKAPARRPRRTKAQIEADKAAEEQAKQDVKDEAEAAERAEEPESVEAEAALQEEPKTLQEELAEDDETAAEEGPTLQDAVDLATKMVSEGKSADVKSALAEVGAARVSQLKGESIAAFLKILEG